MLCNNKQHDNMAFQACETLPDMASARGKWKVSLWQCRAARQAHPPPPPPPENVQSVQLIPEKKRSDIHESPNLLVTHLKSLFPLLGYPHFFTGFKIFVFLDSLSYFSPTSHDQSLDLHFFYVQLKMSDEPVTWWESGARWIDTW